MGYPQLNGLYNMANRLKTHGGLTQQERMIQDKRDTLNRAVLYSYQGATVSDTYAAEKIQYKALINPNKLKPDYDDKIISIGYESGFKPGTIFDWEGTGTKWLIYLQDLTELAYFKGDIRKCNYSISWERPENDEVLNTYAAIRGPVETKINFIQKGGISVDTPNHSLNIMMPKTEETTAYFKRYSKFYLRGLMDADTKICWRVEAIDSISTPGILEVVAVEYYSNKSEDDIENGIAGGLIAKPVEPENPIIEGKGFIYPKQKEKYIYTGTEKGNWSYDANLPIRAIITEKEIEIQWVASYSGQFDLKYGNEVRTIVIQSLF